MKITKKISLVNRTLKSDRKIQYIVIHWVGAVSSAQNNALFFEKTDRNASAHYFVDETSIYQVVEDKNIAWHCGGNRYPNERAPFYGICSNSNSIGIEMCLDAADSISEKTIKNTAELVQHLMKLYDIRETNIIRHYDVTGKPCPAIYTNEKRWEKVKAVLTGKDK